MFMQKQIAVCLLAVLGAQVFFASATPVRPVSNDESQEDTSENEVSHLQGRGLFDLVPNPTTMLSSGAKALDDNLRTVRSLGQKAVKSTVGTGMELTTGFNPTAFMDMPNDLMKKAVRGARYGSDVAYDAADKTLATIQNLHDKKKQLVNDYVKPVAPTVLTDAMDQIHDRVDNTIENVKQGVKVGRERVSEALASLEDRLERGDSILPTSLTEGLQNAGNTAASWLPTWGTVGGDAGADAEAAAEAIAEEVVPETAKKSVEAMAPVVVPAAVVPAAKPVVPAAKPVVPAARPVAPAARTVAPSARPAGGYAARQPAARVVNQAGRVTRAPQQTAAARGVQRAKSSSWLKR